MQEAAMPYSEEMALSLYQYATLQYTRGLLSHAQELCLDSLTLARRLHKKDSSSHVSPLRLKTLQLFVYQSSCCFHQVCKALRCRGHLQSRYSQAFQDRRHVYTLN